MHEREVQDGDNVIWKCVQAFGGSNGMAAREATKLSETNGEVEVVCTPSGGAQTVRLKLEKDWVKKISDEDLLVMIAAAQ